MEHGLAISITTGIFAGIAAIWAIISIYRWRFEKPRFRITFQDGTDSMNWQASTGGRISIQFENIGKTPASDVHAYVMFPKAAVLYDEKTNSFCLEPSGRLSESAITTLGGKFDRCPYIRSYGTIYLFPEEAVTLEGDLTASSIKDRYTIHGLVICKEGTYKTKGLKINVI